MKLEFYKYEGTGNDFIMIDNRLQHFLADNVKLVEKLCDRRFGIGADGLILLENDPDFDFRMVYFNSDGNPSSMCGNGGRCLVAFAQKLGVIGAETNFIAADGPHYATMYEPGKVSLQMKDVDALRVTPEYVFLDTGSPHHIELVDSVSGVDVKTRGAAVRYSDLYGAKGSNVNFVEAKDENTFKVRTYERGVEDETLACGTGITASAIAAHYSGLTKKLSVNMIARGGSLNVTFQVEANKYKNVMLTGSAMNVFDGEIKI